HCFENASALEVACGGLGDEVEHGRWRFGPRELHVFEENRAELRFFSCDGFSEELADQSSEEKPPEVEGTVEAVKFERLDAEAGLLEEFCCAGNGGEGFRRSRADCGRVEKADANFAR